MFSVQLLNYRNTLHLSIKINVESITTNHEWNLINNWLTFIKYENVNNCIKQLQYKVQHYFYINVKTIAINNYQKIQESKDVFQNYTP